MVDEAAPSQDRFLLAEMTTEFVAAYVSNNHIRSSDLPGLIASVYAALDGLGRAPEPSAAPAKPIAPIPVRKTITDQHLISLEDGKSYRTLKRHLGKLGLTPNDYRQKWNLPSDYPMVAPAFARQRSELAKQIGLGTMAKRKRFAT